MLSLLPSPLYKALRRAPRVRLLATRARPRPSLFLSKRAAVDALLVDVVVHRQEPRRHPKLTGDHPEDILYSSPSTLAAGA
jgi:hypothetical protein